MLWKLRDAMAHAEVTRDPLSILSLDFKEAFDKISHTYLFRTMRSYGFSELFITLIRKMYDQANSSVQINGHIAGHIPNHSSFDKDAPISVEPEPLATNKTSLESELAGAPGRLRWWHTPISPFS
jgi:hypothetical protein